MKSISEKWLRKHYLDLNWTAKMCAEKRGVLTSNIRYLIKEYNLEKWKYGIKHKVWNNYTRSKKQKNLQKMNQPHRKMIIAYKLPKGVASYRANELYEERSLAYEIYESITEASKKLNIKRESIRDCANENNNRISAGGYLFKEYQPVKTQNKDFMIRKYNYQLRNVFAGKELRT